VDGRPSVWVKAGPGVQESLVAGDPGRYLRPPYLGAKGWLDIWPDAEPDPDDLTDHVVTSYRLIAPKRIVRDLDAATIRGTPQVTSSETPPA
ncbi:MAG: hypothetical protein M3Y37_08360, partial [Chloroflexota bacterium]|nr:hypothetical protein [Chloroflexota bacterium]